MLKDLMHAAPSRKIRAFIVMSFFVIGGATVLSLVGADHELAVAALRALTFGGLFCIGGQSLVDSVASVTGYLKNEKPKEDGNQ